MKVHVLCSLNWTKPCCYFAIILTTKCLFCRWFLKWCTCIGMTMNGSLGLWIPRRLLTNELCTGDITGLDDTGCTQHLSNCVQKTAIYSCFVHLCVWYWYVQFLIKLLKCCIKPLELVHHTIYHSVIVFLSSFSTKSNCFAMVTNWKSIIFMIWTEFEAIFWY